MPTTVTNRIGPYDAVTQMFIEPTREPNMKHLRFLRDLAEKGLLDHPQPFGESCGEFAEKKEDAATASVGS